ncbi:unnamed protein product [Pedinophyceae sp. YPF-701]|nr:unnamed protein product [Pedinophyceae sp. YPF-701]
MSAAVHGAWCCLPRRATGAAAHARPRCCGEAGASCRLRDGHGGAVVRRQGGGRAAHASAPELRSGWMLQSPAIATSRRVACANSSESDSEGSLSDFRARLASKYGPAAASRRAARREENTPARTGSPVGRRRRLRPAPSLQRVLGVDLGARKTGVAFSAGGFAPRPLGILDTPRDWRALARQLADMARREGADGIVVGVPVTANGDLADRATDSKSGRACRNFAETLSGVAGLPVIIVNERMTSSTAGDALGRSGARSGGRVDDVAAAMILEAYFDSPSDGFLL